MSAPQNKIPAMRSSSIALPNLDVLKFFVNWPCPRFRNLLLCVVAYFSLVAPGVPYQNTWNDLWPQILQNNAPGETLMLTTTVQVFDPFAEEAANAPESLQSLPELGYSQKIYWQSQELLAIETLDARGALLHFYYESKGDVVNVATQQERPFLTTDILPHYLLFMVKRAKDWENALKILPIQDHEVSLHHDEKFRIFYRIGEPQTENFALIDKQDFLLKSLHYGLQAEEKTHRIQIVFNEMTAYETLKYPKQTDYFIDHRLFKRVTVDSLKSPAQLPLKSLQKKAAEWAKPRLLSLHVDYAQ